MSFDRDRFLNFLTRLQDILSLSLAPRPARRRPTHDHCGPAIESLEERFCLNGTAALLDITSAVQAATSNSATTKASGNDGFKYFRSGSKQDAAPMQGLGGAALEGGGTDVDQAFQWMIGRMGGKGDFLVLSATNDPTYDSYIFKLGGTNSVATLDIPSRAAAMDPAVTLIIENADAVFIAGGNQADYVNFWTGDRKSTRLNSSHSRASRMPSSA